MKTPMIEFNYYIIPYNEPDKRVGISWHKFENFRYKYKGLDLMFHFVFISFRITFINNSDGRQKQLKQLEARRAKFRAKYFLVNIKSTGV